MSLTKRFSKIPLSTALLLVLLASVGCINVKTHSTIEPIYLTLDVNLKVQLQQELDDAFAEIDASSEAIEEE